MNNKSAPKDLRSKSLRLAGVMLELGGKASKGQGFKMAKINNSTKI